MACGKYEFGSANLGFLESFITGRLPTSQRPQLSSLQQKFQMRGLYPAETTKNYEELAKTCEKAEGHKKKLTSASEKMNGSWWGQLYSILAAIIP
jgi:hypothetical protein